MKCIKHFDIETSCLILPVKLFKLLKYVSGQWRIQDFLNGGRH